MYIKIKGQNIYYQTSGQGQDLILLHGWKQDVSTWWGVVDLLKDNFKIWMIDMPGFGRSENPPNPWRVSNYSDLIAQFITENKIKKPILLGHSLGGNISIKLAAKYPNLLSKLILEDSSGLRNKSTIKSQILLIISKFFKYLIPKSNLKEKLRNKLYSSIGSDYLSAGPLKETFQNIVSEDLTTDARKIKIDTLIIWGENDQEVPVSKAKTLYKLIANSQLEIIENVSHFPHLENPKLLIHYVKEFTS